MLDGEAFACTGKFRLEERKLSRVRGVLWLGLRREMEKGGILFLFCLLEEERREKAGDPACRQFQGRFQASDRDRLVTLDTLCGWAIPEIPAVYRDCVFWKRHW